MDPFGPPASLPPEIWAHIGSYLHWDAMRALVHCPLSARGSDGTIEFDVMHGISIATGRRRARETRAARAIWCWYLLHRRVPEWMPTTSPFWFSAFPIGAIRAQTDVVFEPVQLLGNTFAYSAHWMTLRPEQDTRPDPPPVQDTLRLVRAAQRAQAAARPRRKGLQKQDKGRKTRRYNL